MIMTSTVHASELAKKQKEISIAEFFEKNRHLLGFDNPRKALLTTIKEAVDNALDACEDAKVLPEISVEIIKINDSRFRIIVEDNGPGIVKKNIPKVFGKLLYGSKFHKLAQSRGQQGLGISASALYGQLTTGKPIIIKSRTGKNAVAHQFKIFLDTKTNNPKITEEKEIEWYKDHGTYIELELEGSYSKGKQSVDEYIKQTAIVNPHATIIYTNPDPQQYVFARVINKIPPEANEIKPHPYGIELGILAKMLRYTKEKNLLSFLMNEFSRVGRGTAKEICEKATLLPKTKPKKISREGAEKIIKAIKNTRIISPPTDCLSPIGAEGLKKGLKKEIKAEFYASTTRPPAVYRGNPFIVECAMAYGGELKADNQIRIMRFANRVPLLYQQGACAVSEGVSEVTWRNYGVQQSRKSIPVGPLVCVVHIASVWVPFTSESKEAIAHYPELIKEIKLAIQETGRMLGKYIKKKKNLKGEIKKRSYIEKYIPHLASALKELLEFDDNRKKLLEEKLKELLEKKRGKIQDISHKNEEYDEEFANIGKAESDDEDNVEETNNKDDKEKSSNDEDKTDNDKDNVEETNDEKEKEKLSDDEDKKQKIEEEEEINSTNNNNPTNNNSKNNNNSTNNNNPTNNYSTNNYSTNNNPTNNHSTNNNSTNNNDWWKQDKGAEE